MFTVNKATISGEVTKKEEGRHLLLEVTQNVHGMETTFEVFVPEDIKDSISFSEGDNILIRNAICYEKNGRRFKVESPTQLERYSGPSFNNHSFTGMVKAYRQVGDTKNIIIEISQDVAGKIPTSFNLFCPPSLQEEFLRRTPMEPGDYVEVIGAILYEKEGEFRYKAEAKDIGILYYKDYNKGDINAEFLKKGE